MSSRWSFPILVSTGKRMDLRYKISKIVCNKRGLSEGKEFSTVKQTALRIKVTELRETAESWLHNVKSAISPKWILLTTSTMRDKTCLERSSGSMPCARGTTISRHASQFQPINHSLSVPSGEAHICKKLAKKHTIQAESDMLASCTVIMLLGILHMAVRISTSPKFFIANYRCVALSSVF